MRYVKLIVVIGIINLLLIKLLYDSVEVNRKPILKNEKNFVYISSAREKLTNSDPKTANFWCYKITENDTAVFLFFTNFFGKKIDILNFSVEEETDPGIIVEYNKKNDIFTIQ